MAGEVSGAASELAQVVSLLAAGVIAVPLFKRLGLGSVLGYLLAGLAIGPFGLGLFTDAHAILHMAELGVVMFLFVIGLEMEPSQALGMRRAIFGLGLAQVGLCGAALTLVGIAWASPVTVAFIAGAGLRPHLHRDRHAAPGERGSLSTPPASGSFPSCSSKTSSLSSLFSLPLPSSRRRSPERVGKERASGSARGGRGRRARGRGPVDPQPAFQLLAALWAREVLTAAALLVVLGAASTMDLGGLSMAWGRSRWRPALGVELPPSAGSGHRTVPRHPAWPVLPRRWGCHLI